jgi:N-acetylglucosaminyldiphosphoundecaprenol N-acetyl-beta-D-mannosaminyltransferase
MNQGGTFDFWVGEQKRSPKLVRKLKLERLWRFIADPKRNYKKIVDSLGILVYIFRSTRISYHLELMMLQNY